MDLHQFILIFVVQYHFIVKLYHFKPRVFYFIEFGNFLKSLSSLIVPAPGIIELWTLWQKNCQNDCAGSCKKEQKPMKRVHVRVLRIINNLPKHGCGIYRCHQSRDSCSILRNNQFICKSCRYWVKDRCGSAEHEIGTNSQINTTRHQVCELHGVLYQATDKKKPFTTINIGQ